MSPAPSTNATPCCVWRVRGTSNTVYLAGTSHVLPDNQVPFPSAFYAAYAQAKEVYVESDDDAGFLTKTRLLFRALKWFRRHQAEIACPRGRTLADYVSPETTARLKAFYGKRYAEKQTMTPAFLLLSSKAELGGEEGNNPGVEQPMLRAARRDRKPIGLLDDASLDDTVIELLDDLLRQIQHDLARRGADAVIAEEILDGSKDVEDLAAWRRGDLEAMCQDVEEMRRDSPEIYDKLLRQRNFRWLKKLHIVLRGRRDAIVLVGAADLWGEDGLLALLRREGFSCEQLHGIDRPPPAAVDASPAPRGISRHTAQKGAAWQ